jgi:hypothetical protein
MGMLNEIGGGATCTSQSDTMIYANFIPTQPGVVQLWCRIWDTYSSTYAECPHKIVRIAPTITITPFEEDRFCYNNGNPGVLTIGGCTATTGNPTLDRNLEWSITPIVGSEQNTTYDNDRPGWVIFSFTGLPENNDQFGHKSIIATLPGYDVQSDILACVYFDKNARNHELDATTPNW